MEDNSYADENVAKAAAQLKKAGSKAVVVVWYLMIKMHRLVALSI